MKVPPQHTPGFPDPDTTVNLPQCHPTWRFPANRAVPDGFVRFLVGLVGGSPFHPHVQRLAGDQKTDSLLRPQDVAVWTPSKREGVSWRCSSWLAAPKSKRDVLGSDFGHKRGPRKKEDLSTEPGLIYLGFEEVPQLGLLWFSSHFLFVS